MLDKVMKPGLPSNRVIHICPWTLVLQPHEYQARLVLRAGRERTLFIRGMPILGRRAPDTTHWEGRAFLPTEYRYPFEDRLLASVCLGGPPGWNGPTDPVPQPPNSQSRRGHLWLRVDMPDRKLGVGFPEEALSTAYRWPSERCHIPVRPGRLGGSVECECNADQRISCGGEERSRRVV
jgi:hypothetical protein